MTNEACGRHHKMNPIHVLVPFSPAKFSSQGTGVGKASDWIQPGDGFSRQRKKRKAGKLEMFTRK